MCYFNGQKVTHVEFIRLKKLEKLVASYDFLNAALHDGFAYGPIAVLQPVASQTDFDIVQMEWGFIPDSWMGRPLDNRAKVAEWRSGYKNPSGVWVSGITTLNAIGEDMLAKTKIYRDSALYRRCLVLSTGFFEWRHHFPLNKRTGAPTKTAVKIPHFITVKEQPYFFMAGIYKPWTDTETGETINTVSICTTAAPEGHLMAKVHNSKMRMPVILDEALAYEWMFEPMSEARITEVGTTRFPSDRMNARTIAKDFKTALDPTATFVYTEYPEIESVLN